MYVILHLKRTNALGKGDEYLCEYFSVGASCHNQGQLTFSWYQMVGNLIVRCDMAMIKQKITTLCTKLKIVLRDQAYARFPSKRMVFEIKTKNDEYILSWLVGTRAD